MARRRTINRKANQSEYEDDTPQTPAEAEVASEPEAEEEVAETATEAKPKAKRVRKPSTTPRAPSKRSSKAKQTRLKAYWDVCDNSGKPVQRFEFNQKAEAEAYIVEKMNSSEKKPVLYLQRTKEEIKE